MSREELARQVLEKTRPSMPIAEMQVTAVRVNAELLGKVFLRMQQERRCLGLAPETLEEFLSTLMDAQLRQCVLFVETVDRFRKVREAAEGLGR